MTWREGDGFLQSSIAHFREERCQGLDAFGGQFPVSPFGYRGPLRVPFRTENLESLANVLNMLGGQGHQSVYHLARILLTAQKHTGIGQMSGFCNQPIRSSNIASSGTFQQKGQGLALHKNQI